MSLQAVTCSTLAGFLHSIAEVHRSIAWLQSHCQSCPPEGPNLLLKHGVCLALQCRGPQLADINFKRSFATLIQPPQLNEVRWPAHLRGSIACRIRYCTRALTTYARNSTDTCAHLLSHIYLRIMYDSVCAYICVRTHIYRHARTYIHTFIDLFML